MRTGRWAVSVACAALLCLAASAWPWPAVSPRIAGGDSRTIDQAPFVALVSDGQANCTGVIVNATTVWTAAHCVTDDTHSPRVASSLTVVAGVSSTADATGQTATVAAVRVHPRWTSRTDDDDDVAALTLATPLTFNARVGRIDVGQEPAPGQAVRMYGFGTQTPNVGDGHLRSLDETVLGPDVCTDNAVTVCAHAATGTACDGDSGGPLVTTGSTPTLVGLDARGDAACTANDPDFFAKVTAPELRAFLDHGDGSLVAPRHPNADASYSVQAIEGQTMTCRPGTFSGNPAYSATFTDTSSGLVLQSGPSLSYTFTHADVGRTVSCAIVATNTGGSYAVAPLAPTAPVLALRDPGLDLAMGNSRNYAVKAATDAKTLILETADAHRKVVRHIIFPAGSRPLHVKLRGGRYTTCVYAQQTTYYAAGLACIKEAISGSASDLVSKVSARASGHRFRVALSSADPATGSHVTLTWRQDGRALSSRTVTLTRHMRLTSPPVRKGHLLSLALPLRSYVLKGVAYHKATAVLRIGIGR